MRAILLIGIGIVLGVAVGVILVEETGPQVEAGRIVWMAIGGVLGVLAEILLVLRSRR